ncbi:hypothetical protein [Butyrivibrio fibrisolvens]|uniref:hypothetical protein n=1 Tax=Butyrivibrio fibrisolvens TaxID=831 RepID=UPI0018AD4D1E|nr:hypothetical protein [Butyrivibrio fibrisolvens]
MSRRWFTVIIPFLLLVSMIAIQKINCQATRPFLYLTLLTFFVYQSRAFISTPILRGCNTSFDELSYLIEDDEPYFALSKDKITILRNVYNKHVYIVDKLDNLSSYVEAQGNINVIGNSKDKEKIMQALDGTTVSILELGKITNHLVDLERNTEHIPYNTYDYLFDVHIYKIEKIE